MQFPHVGILNSLFQANWISVNECGLQGFRENAGNPHAALDERHEDSYHQ